MEDAVGSCSELVSRVVGAQLEGCQRGSDSSTPGGACRACGECGSCAWPGTLSSRALPGLLCCHAVAVLHTPDAHPHSRVTPESAHMLSNFNSPKPPSPTYSSDALPYPLCDSSQSPHICESSIVSVHSGDVDTLSPFLFFIPSAPTSAAPTCPQPRAASARRFDRGQNTHVHPRRAAGARGAGGRAHLAKQPALALLRRAARRRRRRAPARRAPGRAVARRLLRRATSCDR